MPENLLQQLIKIYSELCMECWKNGNVVGTVLEQQTQFYSELCTECWEKWKYFINAGGAISKRICLCGVLYLISPRTS
jgi:hypothetical protein